MRAAARALEHGFVMTFDYGYAAQELYAPWRTDGTLLCFYRHNPSSDPYTRVGREDMTSHVDFTTLQAVGEESGLRTLGLVSQSEFLSRLGIMEALQPPGEGETDIEEYVARRRAMMELLDPGGLGRIRVLVQVKALDDVPLTGLGEGGDDA
jgi:SAM-dependent MidA family methyltransferase